MGDLFSKDSNEEEKEVKLEIDYENFKYKLPPRLNDEELKEFNEELVEVYKYKCKYELNESKDSDNNTSISFYPSPHVKEEEYGKEVFETKSLLETWMIKKNIEAVDGKSTLTSATSSSSCFVSSFSSNLLVS